jgi:hypothetical protein
MIISIITMTTITKKQVSLALVAVVFATAMIASVIASPDSAFARHHKSVHQSISQHNDQSQSSSVVTAGLGSPVSLSGNNIAVGVNANGGGNAAAQ